MPDIYIFDLSLPGTDGPELTRLIRQAHPTVGIIITSTLIRFGYIPDKDDYYLYLNKPVHPQEHLDGINALTVGRISSESAFLAFQGCN